jgi:hypothetical protein
MPLDFQHRGAVFCDAAASACGVAKQAIRRSFPIARFSAPHRKHVRTTQLKVAAVGKAWQECGEYVNLHYRYDSRRRKRYTTIELIVAKAEWIPRRRWTPLLACESPGARPIWHAPSKPRVDNGIGGSRCGRCAAISLSRLACSSVSSCQRYHQGINRFLLLDACIQ